MKDLEKALKEIIIISNSNQQARHIIEKIHNQSVKVK